MARYGTQGERPGRGPGRVTLGRMHVRADRLPDSLSTLSGSPLRSDCDVHRRRSRYATVAPSECRTDMWRWIGPRPTIDVRSSARRSRRFVRSRPRGVASDRAIPVQVPAAMLALVASPLKVGSRPRYRPCFSSGSSPNDSSNRPQLLWHHMLNRQPVPGRGFLELGFHQRAPANDDPVAGLPGSDRVVRNDTRVPEPAPSEAQQSPRRRPVGQVCQPGSSCPSANDVNRRQDQVFVGRSRLAVFRGVIQQQRARSIPNERSSRSTLPSCFPALPVSIP